MCRRKKMPPDDVDVADDVYYEGPNKGSGERPHPESPGTRRLSRAPRATMDPMRTCNMGEARDTFWRDIGRLYTSASATLGATSRASA